MRTLLIIPVTMLLALTACNEQKPAEATNRPTSTPTQDPSDKRVVSNDMTRSSPMQDAKNGQIPSDAAALNNSYKNRAYSAGPVTMKLNANNTFNLMQNSGDKGVEGQYVFKSGVLTLSDPRGDIGLAKFPMRCGFQEKEANDFTLTDPDGSCSQLKDLTFKPTSG